jgi:hypothetical protein
VFRRKYGIRCAPTLLTRKNVTEIWSRRLSVNLYILKKLAGYFSESLVSIYQIPLRHMLVETILNVNVVLFIQCAFLQSLYPHRNLTPSWTLNEDIAKQLIAFGRTVLRITFWGINVNDNGESDIIKNCCSCLEIWIYFRYTFIYQSKSVREDWSC